MAIDTIDFTKRHYTAIAKVIADERARRQGEKHTPDDWNDGYHEGQLDEIDNLVFALVRLFDEDNPVFNRDLFLQATGTED